MSQSPGDSKTADDLSRRAEDNRAAEAGSTMATRSGEDDDSSASIQPPSSPPKAQPKETQSPVKKQTLASYMSELKQRKQKFLEQRNTAEEGKGETKSVRSGEIEKSTAPEVTSEPGNTSSSNHEDTKEVSDANESSSSQHTKGADRAMAAPPSSLPANQSAHDVLSSPAKKLTSSLLSSELSPLPSTMEDLEAKLPAPIPEDAEGTPEKDDYAPDEDSDAETVIGSPVKKRGRLVRKSDIDTDAKLVKKVDFDDDDEYMESEDEAPKKKTKKSYGALQNSRSSSPGKAVKRTKGGRDHSGRRMLQRVCEKGYYDQAKKLIEEGADVNDQDYAGNTALHEAALLGYTEIVELLLENGATVDLQNGPDDLDTPLIDAAANAHVDTVKVLLKYGADPRIENARGQNALDSLEEGGAATKNLKKMLRDATKKLTKEGKKHDQSGPNSDVDERSRSRSRPRGGRRAPSARSEMLWVDFTSKAGLEEVYKRARDGDVQFVGNYLQNVAKPDAEALALAAKFGHTDVVNLFLAFGAQVDVTDEDGQTALMRTVGRGHLDTVKLLLDAGAKVSTRSHDGKTAMDYAQDSLMVNEDEVAMLRAAMNGEPVVLPESHQEKRSSQKREDKPRREMPSHKMHTDDENSSDSKKLHVKKRKLSVKDEHREHSPDLKKKKVIKNESSQPEHTASASAAKPKQSAPAPSASKPEVKRVVSAPKLDRPVVKEPEKPVAPPPETEEQKQARLKREEEDRKRREAYEAAIIAKRKAREQQFLNNFESEAKKKEEELRKLSQLEQERKEREAKVQEAKIKEEELLKEEKMKTEEVVKIQKLRESYPTGLRCATFSDSPRSKAEALKYMPLYKIFIDDVAYLIDIQVIMAIGVDGFYKKFPVVSEKAKTMTKDEKTKVFKLLDPFLVDNSLVDVKKRLENHAVELEKFQRLHVRWIPFDDVVELVDREFNDLVALFRSRVIVAELEGLGNGFVKTQVDSTAQRSVSGPRSALAMVKQSLPRRLQFRLQVTKAMSRNKQQW